MISAMRGRSLEREDTRYSMDRPQRYNTMDDRYYRGPQHGGQRDIRSSNKGTILFTLPLPPSPIPLPLPPHHLYLPLQYLFPYLRILSASFISLPHSLPLTPLSFLLRFHLSAPYLFFLFLLSISSAHLPLSLLWTVHTFSIQLQHVPMFPPTAHSRSHILFSSLPLYQWTISLQEISSYFSITCQAALMMRCLWVTHRRDQSLALDLHNQRGSHAPESSGTQLRLFILEYSTAVI